MLILDLVNSDKRYFNAFFFIHQKINEDSSSENSVEVKVHLFHNVY